MISDWLFDIATSYPVLGIIAIGAIAALVIGNVPFGKYAPAIGPYVVLAHFVAYLGLMLLTFLVGFRLADERAATKQLKADLAFTELQLTTQKSVAADAQRLRQDAEAQNADLNRKVSTYEDELAKRPNTGCDLDNNDVDSLRGIAR
jgi:hypothetical protein